MDYLRRVREEQESRSGEVNNAHAVAERIHDVLAAFAVATRRLAPQDPRLTGHTGTMVHNAAYLVPRDLSDRFAAAVADATAEHPDVEVDAARTVAAVLLRDAGRAVTSTSLATQNPPSGPDTRPIALVDLLDRLLGTGVVLSGDVVISLAGVDLVEVRLRALIRTVRGDEEPA